MRCLRVLLLSFGMALVACGDVDLNAVPSAKALCESSTEDLRQPSARMLPGRRCLVCHAPGGQASRLLWTAGGTVYASPGSDCNSNGVDGAQVELVDANGVVVTSLRTNRSGNFFTADSMGSQPLRARVRVPGKPPREMQQPQLPPIDCAACHYPGGPAGGRIYID